MRGYLFRATVARKQQTNLEFNSTSCIENNSGLEIFRFGALCDLEASTASSSHAVCALELQICVGGINPCTIASLSEGAVEMGTRATTRICLCPWLFQAASCKGKHEFTVYKILRQSEPNTHNERECPSEHLQAKHLTSNTDE